MQITSRKRGRGVRRVKTRRWFSTSQERRINDPSPRRVPCCYGRANVEPNFATPKISSLMIPRNRVVPCFRTDFLAVFREVTLEMIVEVLRIAAEIEDDAPHESPIRQ